MKFSKKSLLGLLALTATAYGNTVAQGNINRSELPVPDASRPEPTVKYIDEVKQMPAPYQEVKAPEGAPNVIVILLDDFGYGHSDTFGGPIEMPTLSALAKEGLQYTMFHTTSLSSPTRSALLTGRNHHMVNMGSITEIGTSEPGNTGVIPNQTAQIQKILKENGYRTSAYGKDHQIPPWQVGPTGNQKEWPTTTGFDYFYGFFGGESDQYQPVLVEGINVIETPRDNDYQLTGDLTNKAIKWMHLQKDMNPDQPFFMYFAPGATHAPHQVSKEWVDRYKGKFDKGWDAVREETFAKQKAMGIIPQDAVLPSKPEAVKDWDKLTPEEKEVFAKQMEVFAGYASYADHEIGRLLAELKEMDQFDNTLIFYIAGDNGASGEGGFVGLLTELTYFNNIPESIENMKENIDKFGTRESQGHYAIGWAVAGDTPFRWTKQVGSDYGGTANGMVISWPNGIKSKGELRKQWSYVTDIAPTILEAAKIPEPKKVDGIEQIPMQGTSLVYSFNDADTPSKHTTQYFEMFGNRGIYHDGWMARTIHKAPWGQDFAKLQDDKWELYDTIKDPTLSKDLSKEHPEKLKELQEVFDREAKANHVFPIDDRTFARLNAALAGRPSLFEGRDTLTLHEGAVGMSEDSFIDIKNRDFTITANIDIKDAKAANGVIIAQGSEFAGWSLFLENGLPNFTYNYLKREITDVVSDAPLKQGLNTVKVVFKYNENNEGGKGVFMGWGKGGNVYLYLNDQLVGKAKINNTIPLTFATTPDGTDVGMDNGGSVSPKYAEKAPFKFNEKIKEIKVDVGPQEKPDPEGTVPAWLIELKGY